MSKELTGTEAVGEIEGQDYVVCQICEKQLKSVTNTHLKLHNITIKEYKELYPNSELTCNIIQDKIKRTNLERYGVENPLQSQIIKDKKKETCIDQYGVEHPFQSQIVKDKIKRTNLERYGVENPLQLQIIKDKKKETCIERFGVEHISQSQIIKDRKKETCFEHFGVDHPFQTQIVKDKMKETNLEKYGVEYASQSGIIKDKKKETCLEHFGVESPLQSQIIKDKKNETCFNRYGFISPSKNLNVKIKLSCNLQNINIEDFNGFISFDPYCEDFNPTKKKEVRDKYDDRDYLTGIHRDICNIMKNGKVWELTVHHVDYNKNQGCDGVKWKLVPVSQRHNTMFNKNRPFWEKLILYALEYDKEYYEYKKINIFG